MHRITSNQNNRQGHVQGNVGCQGDSRAVAPFRACGNAARRARTLPGAVAGSVNLGATRVAVKEALAALAAARASPHP